MWAALARYASPRPDGKQSVGPLSAVTAPAAGDGSGKGERVWVGIDGRAIARLPQLWRELLGRSAAVFAQVGGGVARAARRAPTPARARAAQRPFSTGHRSAARRAARIGLRAARARKDKVGEAHCLKTLGVLLVADGHLDRAKPMVCPRARARVREPGARSLVGVATRSWARRRSRTGARSWPWATRPCRRAWAACTRGRSSFTARSRRSRR